MWPALAAALALAEPPALTQPLWLGKPPARAARIVSLAPSATEIVFALGAGASIVGVTRFDDYPAEVAARPKVGGFIDPDLEAVLALRPDLVVAIPTSGGRRIADSIAALGVPVLILPANELDDLYRAIDTLGSLLDRGLEAQGLSAALRQRYASLMATRRPLRRVLLLVETRPIIAAGPGTFLHRVLTDLGAENVVTRGGAYPLLDLEATLALAPEVIVDVSIGHSSDRDLPDRLHTLGSRARYVRLRHDGLLRIGPRLPEGVDALASAVWPASAP